MYLHLIDRYFLDGNTFPAIAVGRLEWGQVRAIRFLVGNHQKRSKTGHQRAIWSHFWADRAVFPANEKTLYA